MSEPAESVSGLAQPAALGIGEQLARDARTRIVAAAGVVLVHSTYPPGNAVLESMSPTVQGVSAAVYTLAVTFPVHAFVFLSFLHLVPRLQAGVPTLQLLRSASGRLIPAHLFWVSAYLIARMLLDGRPPSGAQVLSGVLIGSAAEHLYFIPLLLVLTACVPLWSFLSRTPVRAGTSVLGLSLFATWLRQTWGVADGWISSLIVVLGMGPMAIVGLYLGRTWRGVGPVDNRSIILGVGSVVSICAGLLAGAAFHSGGQPLALHWHLWLSRLCLGVGVPILLLAISGPVPMWLIRIAPYTLGVYFLHPLSIKAVQWLEAYPLGLAGREAGFILPNAVIAAVMSLVTVMVLARTPLKRFVL